MSRLDWLTARPVAHRGLHDAAAGLIENTPTAVVAAIESGYAIEVDLQLTADGDAVVHHDDALGRLTEGTGPLAEMTAAQLRRIPFRATADRMMTLGELCDLVAGRVTLVLELKSHGDRDTRLAARVAKVLETYRGRVAVMSFDPRQIAALRRFGPSLTGGIVAERARRSPGYAGALILARPNFVAYSITDLPAFAPLAGRQLFGMPLLTWTVRTPAERRRAARFADQIIFEGFRP